MAGHAPWAEIKGKGWARRWSRSKYHYARRDPAGGARAVCGYNFHGEPERWTSAPAEAEQCQRCLASDHENWKASGPLHKNRVAVAPHLVTFWAVAKGSRHPSVYHQWVAEQRPSEPDMLFSPHMSCNLGHVFSGWRAFQWERPAEDLICERCLIL